jgi:Family of unknown function (DUF6496)
MTVKIRASWLPTIARYSGARHGWGISAFGPLWSYVMATGVVRNVGRLTARRRKGTDMPSSEVMHKFKKGKLHSGSKTGKKVTNPKQAVAIMMSEKRGEKAGNGKKARERRLADKEI